MTSPRFNPALESLRGLASLGVCLAHSLAVYRLDDQARIYTVPLWRQSPPSASLSLISSIFSAHNAVVLFFVLSGYVLTLSLAKPDQSIATFYRRRALRILPAMWAALLFCYAAAAVDHTPRVPVSDWYQDFFEPPASFADLLRNFMLIDFRANPVTWTMRIELLGSMLMPLLAPVVQRGSRLIHIAVLLALAGLVVVAPADFRYILCFYAGALLTRYAVPVPGWSIVGGLIISTALQVSGLQNAHSSTAIWIATFASCAILGGVIRVRPRILETRPLRFLGRVSYSLYLLHPGVLGLCALALFATSLTAFPATLLLIGVSIPLACILAAVSHAWVEMPFQLGRNRQRAVLTTPSSG